MTEMLALFLTQSKELGSVVLQTAVAMELFFLPHNRTKVWDVRPAVPERVFAPNFYVYEYGDYEIKGQKDTRPRRLMLWTGSEHFRALAFVENAGSHGTSRAQAQAI